jgi:CBS domain-containing protein
MRSQAGKHLNAAILAIGYMAVGIALAVLFSKWGIDLGVTFGIIMLAPLLLYLIVSGSISEFSAPGGFGAKFRDAAAAPVQTTANIEGLELVQKGDRQAIITRARGLTPGKPIALTFALNDPAPIDRFGVENYVQTLRRIDPDLSVIFVHPNGTFAASTDGARVEAVLNNDHYGDEFIRAVLTGDISALRELVSVSNRSIGESASNGQALRIMNEDGVRSLVAVNADQHPVGIVRRDRIVSELVAGLSA